MPVREFMFKSHIKQCAVQEQIKIEVKVQCLSELS